MTPDQIHRVAIWVRRLEALDGVTKAIDGLDRQTWPRELRYEVEAFAEALSEQAAELRLLIERAAGRELVGNDEAALEELCRREILDASEHGRSYICCSSSVVDGHAAGCPVGGAP